MHQRGFRLLALAVLLTACAEAGAPPPEPGLRISFEDREEAAAFFRQGEAVRDAKDGAAGLWAAVPALRRPERAEVVNPRNGRSTVVALFVAPRRAGAVVLSNEAADALGITGTATVRITALRREAQIDTTGGR